MRKIILASKSKARQNLLRQIGLKFQVAESKVKERRSLTKGCGKLVMSNARKKAEDVARRFASGVVIAADTLVLAGKRIIGKPKDAQDAFKTLKTLSRKPQWVYTGLTVVDIDHHQVFSAYDKTKVYMYPLSNEQIKRYLRKVSPLDKAGSFDIQGLGGIFIDRIEGCFYNVVGLPLAKLARLLEKAGIELF